MFLGFYVLEHTDNCRESPQRLKGETKFVIETSLGINVKLLRREQVTSEQRMEGWKRDGEAAEGEEGWQKL